METRARETAVNWKRKSQEYQTPPIRGCRQKGNHRNETLNLSIENKWGWKRMYLLLGRAQDQSNHKLNTNTEFQPWHFPIILVFVIPKIKDWTLDSKLVWKIAQAIQKNYCFIALTTNFMKYCGLLELALLLLLLFYFVGLFISILYIFKKSWSL